MINILTFRFLLKAAALTKIVVFVWRGKHPAYY